MSARAGRQFETREIAGLLGVTPRRIEGWVEQKLLVPRVGAAGTGSRRRFLLESVARGTVLLALQSVFGERSEYVRLGLEAVVTFIPDVEAQLARGEVLPPEQNVVILMVDENRQVRAGYGAWGPEDADVVARALADNDDVVLVPLTGWLNVVLERLEELERARP